MIETKVTRKGQTVVPAPIRKIFSIGENSRLIWSTDSKVITVVPVSGDPIQNLRGYTAGKDLRKALIKKRKEDENRA